MIEAIILGVGGKMGSTIARLAEKDKDIKIAALVEKKGNPLINSTLYGCTISDNLLDVIENGNVIIDFTSHDSFISHIDIAKRYKKAMVIGTTGISPHQIAYMEDASKHIPIFYSENMSFGMNVIFKLLPQISKLLSDFDIEIIEAHHREKIDAPSGTAKKIFEILVESRGYDLLKSGIYGRKEKKKRNSDEIGIMSIRAGDIVGDHTIIFAGFGERIELTHRATSRDVFAYGALKAAKFIIHQEPGLYSVFSLFN